ncbi:MAG: hypothetical protein SFY96_03085 [Planctomycetota bacterium]|nr:hypothetical protein [Planctomycetota bacterium]
MASRRYGVWDMVALHARVGSRRTRPRRVPSLGHRPTRLQRGLSVPGNWSPTAIRAIYTLPFQFGVLMPQPAIQMLTGWYSTFAFIAIGALCVFFVLVGTLSILVDDPRCVLLRRRRERITTARNAPKAADKLVQRRKFWRLQIDNPDSGTFVSLMRTSWWSLLIAAVPLVSSLFILVGPTLMPGAVRARLSRDIWTWIALIVLGICMYSVPLLKASRRKKALHRSTLSNVCPECAYEQPRGTIGRTSDGTLVDFGPPRCPECGMPWPLIPPET